MLFGPSVINISHKTILPPPFNCFLQSHRRVFKYHIPGQVFAVAIGAASGVDDVLASFNGGLVIVYGDGLNLNVVTFVDAGAAESVNDYDG